MTAFVDFIRISQRHPGRFNPETFENEPLLPLVDAGIVGKYGRDVETGDYSETPEWATASKLHVAGSFDSLIIVRSDGFKVELEGNVGRFNRPDNLFNLDFDATIAQCNEILAMFGLPPFSAGEQQINTNPSDYDVRHGLFECWTGATLSELHLTRNYECGSEANAKAAIDWLSTQSVSRVKRGKCGETSVQWGSKGGRKLLKAYLKAPEMLAHKHGRKTDDVLKDPVYLHCQHNGVLRLELEAKRLTLRDHGLRYLGDITQEKLTDLFESEASPIMNRTKTDLSRLELEHLPAKVRVTAAAYLAGQNIRALMSRPTFYRHAKALLEYGIDILEPLDNTKSFSSVIRVIDIKPMATAPDWYWTYQRNMMVVAANAEPAANETPIVIAGCPTLTYQAIRATGTDTWAPPPTPPLERNARSHLSVVH